MNRTSVFSLDPRKRGTKEHKSARIIPWERHQSGKCFQSVGPEFFTESGKSLGSLASLALSICTSSYSLIAYSFKKPKDLTKDQQLCPILSMGWWVPILKELTPREGNIITTKFCNIYIVTSYQFSFLEILVPGGIIQLRYLSPISFCVLFSFLCVILDLVSLVDLVI